MSKAFVLSAVSLAAVAALATPAVAAQPAAASGSIHFFHFEDSTGQNKTSCDEVVSGPSGSACSGLTVYSGGPLGDGLHVSGTKSGSGEITAAGAPKVSVTLNASGGDGVSGAGLGEVEAKLDYYVTILPLGSLGTAGLKIPLIFDDAGQIDAGGSNAQVTAEASTFLRAIMGDITVDGGSSNISDSLDDTVAPGSLSESYAHSHHVLFDYGGGDVIAKVSLAATCVSGALTAAAMSATCSAFADPFTGFDQDAFDLKMGVHTFNLADNFEIVLSPGLQDGPSGVPEPGAWTLLIAGAGLAGAALRRRRDRRAGETGPGRAFGSLFVARA
jgi:hypothetical protein